MRQYGTSQNKTKSKLKLEEENWYQLAQQNKKFLTGTLMKLGGEEDQENN